MEKRQNKKRKSRFLAVDLWQKEFGAVSEKAIFSLFAEKFSIPYYNLNKYNFSYCLESLRSLENPDYKKKNK